MTYEESLVKAAKNGDTQAFSAIVRLYEKQVYNSALYIAKNEDDALDISQNVFLKLWQNISSFRQDCSLKTYIARITKNAAIDYIRTRNSKSTLPTETDDGNILEFEDTDELSQPQNHYHKEEIKKAIRQAVSTLSDGTRECIIMRDIQGLSYKEISDAMGLPEGTVKSRINRGREQLKFLLQKWNFL